MLGEYMQITYFSVENLKDGCVTDNLVPRFSFALASGEQNVALKEAVIEVNGCRMVTKDQVLVPYSGKPLEPFTRYTANLTATLTNGESASAQVKFSTGRLGVKWQGSWITDGSYKFTERKVSPVPMNFRRRIEVKKPLARAEVYATAMGIFELEINGRRVGDRYFAPGFTSYKHTLQYCVYDVTEQLKTGGELLFVVAGGWAVGSFVFTRKNRITAKRQALLAEVRLWYADGSSEVIATDESWQTAMGGRYVFADFYDGETCDGTADMNKLGWHAASCEKISIHPVICAEYGAPVRAQRIMKPVSCTVRGRELIYDFGQNFAGVVCAKINGRTGQEVIFRHAEVLENDGGLAARLLRSAKATAKYICREGVQTYSPRFTYMGFRYVSVTGIDREDIELTAYALWSDVEQTGEFACSDRRINRLQSNIVWSARSNFVDIPTDCPQRDERMGWTGDIGLFAPTACFNFNMSRFLEKWLADVKSEQLKTGGIPNTVPVQGYGFPATMPVMAMDFWGDACILVPWAMYLAYGDRGILEMMYPVMKKYVKACRFWAGFGAGNGRYIWHTPAVLHFGDWVAPDVDKMSDWQKRSKWTATASLCNTSRLLAEVAHVLGKEDEAGRYKKLSQRVARAYTEVFTDGEGKLKEEFQTAYVLPLAFGMFPEGVRERAAENLARIAERDGWRIGTGFPGTPFLLFALADNGQRDAAFNMLMNEKCPSWLYEVKAGGTTIWERWDALKEDGTLNGCEDDGTGGMVSFNHYASGSVGNFLYSRVAGIFPKEAGYKKFAVRPLPGGGLTWARVSVRTPYGMAAAGWKAESGRFILDVEVPVSAECEITMPDGTVCTVGSGKYTFGCELQ